jgi:hypothetical protein
MRPVSCTDSFFVVVVVVVVAGSSTTPHEGHVHLRGYIQKFPDWPPEARTANGTALCH